ncbi:peptidylprolyl isomerase [Anaerosalibacter sp. Marseille-P3206]|uniref:peptidylprolyl isomerase n=1 Tax=Anaerosalibacter sp. Marseille-P3206 TaxID=1871005 RepID=UPI0013566F8E|nr:peptidylprolyl isomerase [Anaerosalibacter sp. Marseille-P3206]
MIKFNKKVLLILALVVLATFTLAACEKAPKDAVAKVNGENISKTEFDKDFDMYKNVYKKQFGEDIMSKDAGNGKTFEEAIKEQVLEKIIMEKIILENAKKEEITVTDDELNNQIKSYKEVLGSDEKYKTFLSENNLTEEYFKEGIKTEMIIDKYRTKYIEGLKIDEKEAKKHFEENKDSYIKVKASHILVETEEQAKSILEKIKNGEDFHALAGKESIDSGSAVNGGDLGYFRKGDMVPQFEEAAFSLEPGKISDIVQSDYGYHIIKVEERLENFEDLKDEVMENLKNTKYQENIKKLREEAKVKTYMEKEEKQEEKQEESKTEK